MGLLCAKEEAEDMLYSATHALVLLTFFAYCLPLFIETGACSCSPSILLHHDSFPLCCTLSWTQLRLSAPAGACLKVFSLRAKTTSHAGCTDCFVQIKLPVVNIVVDLKFEWRMLSHMTVPAGVYCPCQCCNDCSNDCSDDCCNDC